MRLLYLAPLVGLTSCASVLSGTSQEISVNTNPSGANCGLYRQQERIATIQDTPGSALVQKTKNNIWVACVKPGFLPASYLNHSGTADASFGNILAGGLIGVAVDSATGADNKYENSVNVSLIPKPEGAPDIAELPQRFDGAFPVPTPSQPVAEAPGHVRPSS